MFAGRSRGARRTWCGRDECGNRVKAAAYRARLRGEEPTPAFGLSPALLIR
ncbi:CGNR zinc finger domain-containing protein [Glaciihabitans sp. GrIS 2.15]|uniref:CGNR zinc finger domain-containing protein n=1 Tax=Glaciihabitans sp. GrIS 2.15 TaxID=3071710 RepID=UPI003FA3B75C